MIEITLAQAKRLVEVFCGDENAVLVLQQSQVGPSGPGLYARCRDNEYEGSIWLGESTE